MKFLSLCVLATVLVGCPRQGSDADPVLGTWVLKGDQAWPQTAHPIMATGFDEISKKLATATDPAYWPGPEEAQHVHVWRKSGDDLYDYRVLRQGITVAFGKIRSGELATSSVRLK